jgi:nucleotide-binding universal stress UspA family protein
MTESFQIRKILIPTDFSVSADNALFYAAELAKKIKAELLLYHAYPIPIVDVNMPAAVFMQVTQEAESNARQYLEKLCLKLKEQLTLDCPCSYILAQDFNADKVVKTAGENSADLIIMGTHGASGLAEFIMGTNTARVVEKAHCPVLAIPENVSFTPIQKILFTTDYRDTDFPTLKKIVPLADLFNAGIIVMHVFQHDRKLESHMLEWFKEELENHIQYGNITYVLEENEKVIEAINDYIDKKKVSILVASTRKHNLLEKIFHTSITKKLTYHPHVPFLVFHYTKDEENKVETS